MGAARGAFVRAVFQLDRQVASMPDLSVLIHEDIFRIRELEMDWDIGVVVYDPENADNIPIGPDGKKIGIFLLHGGVSDFKSVERIARILPGKFGIKVASMTFPGRFYFLDRSRDWAGRRGKQRQLRAHPALDQGNSDYTRISMRSSGSI
jgi:hypothetical protein